MEVDVYMKIRTRSRDTVGLNAYNFAFGPLSIASATMRLCTFPVAVL
jgi:hypothetical protein